MVQTAQFDPIVVEPRLTAEKISELFGHRGESAKLDYKSEYDPSNTTQRVKLVKHVLAMANTVGGYIVIGVDDDGCRRGLDQPELEKIDEAIVRSQIAGYASVPIPIFVAKGIEVDNLSFAIVTVLPVMDTIVVAAAEGNCPEKTLFRKGDVLVRHGSASERWTPSDADFILRKILSGRKEEWLREFGQDLRRLVGLPATNVSQIDEKAFELSAGDFQNLAVELLRKPNG
jgi:hypothetical protein